MHRILPLLAIGAALAGCDSNGGATIEYRVSGSASTAEVAVDGGEARTVDLPYTAESSGSSFSVRALADAPVDVTVRVDGAVREQATGRAVALGGDADASEVEVKGGIEAVDAESLTVLGLTFAIDARTEIEGDDDAVLALTDLAVGDRVEIEAHDRGGVLVASEVELDDDADDNEVEAEGTVEAIDLDAETVTVMGFTFAVTAETEVEDDGDFVLTDLVPGDRVEVEGYIDAEGGLVAEEIELDEEDDEDDDD